jgi:hypothetical protein
MSVATQRLSKLRRAAYHQAGRAAMCIIRRRGFHFVAAVPGRKPLGEIRLSPIHLYNGHEGSPDLRKAEREVVIDMAGPIAERIASGQQQWRGTGRDLLSAPRAIELACQICQSHDAARAYLKYLWLDTRDRLVLPPVWHAVQMLAAELIDQRRLSNRLAHALYRQALEDGEA